MARVPRLLLAEHEQNQPSPIGRTLESAGLFVVKATSGGEALKLAITPPDLALVNLQLPDLDGCEVCRRLKSDPSTSQFPIILTSYGAISRALIIKCFDCGAVDYFAYPIPDEELLARVGARIRLGAMDSRWTNRLLQQQTDASQARIARLKAALEIAQLGIWELTAQLGVWQNHPISAAAQFDKRCLDLLGISQEKPVLLDDLLSLILPDQRERVRDHMAQALGMYGTGIIDVECRIIRPDGSERWIAMRAHEVKSEISKSHLRFVGTIMDITERKRALELLIRSEKVAALGQMAATLAHEINNPLAAVVNALYLARTNINNAEQAGRYLKIADEQVSEVTHITRQALGFYRERTTPAPISVVDVMKETMSLLKTRIRGRHVFLESGSVDDTRVIGVGGELRQVFSNLIANSLEAIRDDGTIRIRISRLGAVRNDDVHIRITVADDGKGITPSGMTHLFEPLFTTKGVGGTGLGLWVSKQIIEKHGGSIRVKSRTHEPQRGTVFAILLPAVPGESAVTTKRERRRLTA